jgi:hypothetical protein
VAYQVERTERIALDRFERKQHAQPPSHALSHTLTHTHTHTHTLSPSPAFVSCISLNRANQIGLTQHDRPTVRQGQRARARPTLAQHDRRGRLPLFYRSVVRIAMLKSKKFVKKTKRGAVLTVTAEHYLRRDIWCSHERCAVCKVGQLTRLLARRLAQEHNHAGVASATCARSRGLLSVKSSPAYC